MMINIKGYAEQNNFRIKWSGPMSNEIPWYVYEVPTFGVSSFNYIAIYADATMLKCFVRCTLWFRRMYKSMYR